MEAKHKSLEKRLHAPEFPLKFETGDYPSKVQAPFWPRQEKKEQQEPWDE